MSRPTYLVLLLSLFVFSACEVLEDHAFTVTGSEVGFTFPEQHESNSYHLTKEVDNPDIEGRLKDRGLPVNMLSSVKLASLTLFLDSDDPNFDVSSITNVKVNASLAGRSSIAIATGDFTGWQGDDALLTVADVELLEYVTAETMEFTIRFEVTEQPAAPIDVRLEPEFTAVTSLF